MKEFGMMHRRNVDNKLNYINENRRLDIDIAKGIAIYLVILGHSYSTSNGLITLIYSFHMPFFFIVTGILYSYVLSIKVNWKNIRTKIVKLILPYIIWGALYQFFIGTLQFLGGESSLDEIIRIRFFTYVSLDSGAMWFLPASFIGAIIFMILINKKILNIILCSSMLVLGLLWTKTNCVIEPILRAFVGYGFIAIGFYGRKIFMSNVKNIVLLMLFLLQFVLAFFNGTVNLSARQFGNPCIYICMGCIGSFILLKISDKILNIKENILKRCLIIAGQNSVIILCLHMFFIEIIRLLDFKLTNNILNKIGIFEGLVLGTFVYLILIVLIPIFVNYFGWTWGIKYSKNSSRVVKKDVE